MNTITMIHDKTNLFLVEEVNKFSESLANEWMNEYMKVISKEEDYCHEDT